MNKLVVSAVAVAISIVANAASANWNFANDDTIYNGTDTSTALGAGYAVYIFDADVTSANSVYNQWAGGTTALTGSIATGTTIAGGQLSINNIEYGDQSTSAEAKYYNYFFAIVDGSTKVFISETKSAKANKSASVKTVTLSDVDSDSKPETTFSQGSWLTVETPEPEPTPEPTSGLLLALGMATLALRRKQK